MKKIIRYRLSVSVKFPATHPRKGEETFFKEKVQSSLKTEPFCKVFLEKLHTIRANYLFWQKRFEKINKGQAVLELYYWSGKPYNSKCITVCQLGKDDGIGIQKLEFSASGLMGMIKIDNGFPEHGSYHISELSKNDGLTQIDFEAWFKNYDLSELMAIIHFTKFRY